ncbi:MAG: hypothetical protein VB070_09350 [Clostridiaceae bacterium]|nr:hypothetical protein [Clostridiaceae bacterium]
MITHFANSRWSHVKENYENWWTNQLERPIFNIQIHGADPGLPKPEEPIYANLSSYDLSVPMATIIKHCEYSLCSRYYLGDSYPTYLPDFGAGVNAAFVGAKHLVRPETVWFEAEKPLLPEQLSFRHHPENIVYQRIVDFYNQANTYFKGSVVLGMTHLNNGIDIPARFFNGVDFCLALYDSPEEIERLVWENHELFLFYMHNLSSLMNNNPGYTCWGDILANDPWMGTQSDFSAMIGPEQFDRFILPELAACLKACPKYNFYHLDGREELIHLDKILAIPELQVVQWVAGDDELPDREWMQLYKKIHDAGKKIWYLGPEENLDLLADTLGSLKGVYWQAGGSGKDIDHFCRTMEKFGVPGNL